MITIDKYRVASNITEYYIVLILIFQRIVISKFNLKNQLSHLKNVLNKQHVLNGRTDPLARIIELLSFLLYILPN